MGMKSKCVLTFAYRSLRDLLLPVPVQFGDAEACREFTTIPIVHRNTKPPYLFNLISLFLKIIEKILARKDLWTSFGAPFPVTMANFEIRPNFKVNSLFSGYFKPCYRVKYHYHHNFPPFNW